MTSRVLSPRLLHTTALSRARLINSAISISPEHALKSPPAPPPPKIESNLTPRSPRNVPGSHSSESTAVRASGAAPSALPQGQRPEVAHTTRLAVEENAGDLAKALLRKAPTAAPGEASRTAQEHDEDRAAGTAFDVFLIRTLEQLSRAEVGQQQQQSMEQPQPQPGTEASAAARAATQRWLSLPELAKQKRDREGRVVDQVSLAYEPTPRPQRRLRLDGRTGTQEAPEATVPAAEEQDGIVIVAHVLGGANPKVSICSGFAIGTPQERDAGQTVLTCAHTLESIEQHLSPSEAVSPSATLILAPSGHVYPVQELLSSVGEADLLLLRLAPDPINPSALPARALRPLPINPYPAPVTTEVSVHRYLNPLSRLRRKLRKLPEREWEQGSVREYKDPIGRTAEPGTYDALHSMLLSCAPTSGSSGGPVIDTKSGSVIGITRGSTHRYGERQQYGFATPSERVFEMFRLPGFKTSAERDVERLARGSRDPSGANGGSGGSNEAHGAYRRTK